MTTDPAVTLVFFALVFLLLLVFLWAAERFLSWRDFDRYRRLSRRAHLNIVRGLIR